MSEREFSILQHPKCPVHWLNIVFNNYIIQEHIIICVYRHKLTLLQMNSILHPFCHVISTGVLHIAMQHIWQSGAGPAEAKLNWSGRVCDCVRKHAAARGPSTLRKIFQS